MIPFLDLAKVNNRFRLGIDTRFARILDKGNYLQGEQNELFSNILLNFAAQSLLSALRTGWTR